MIHGKFIEAKAFAKEGTYIRQPQNVVNGSDMSGYCGVDLEATWLTEKDITKDIWIGFDLGSIVRLGYMSVWNFNQTDGFEAGIKKAKIYYSYDNEEYFEFKGEGYPYTFARANGKPNLKATNLDDGKNSPINFNGLSARYIKIVPDIESAEGCHGKYIEGQTRYGLSQVRFFLYRSEPKQDSYLYARALDPEMDVLTSNYGLEDGEQILDENTMYLSKLGPVLKDMIFDLNMCTCIKGIDLINYNEPSKLNAGIKKFKLYYSLNTFDWIELGCYELNKAKGKNEEITTLVNGELIRFPSVYARYIKLSICGGPGKGTYGYVNGYEFRLGLSKIQFVSADHGYYVEPARDWTALISRFSGWTGSDGIFITNLCGDESKPKGSKRDTVKNVISFGDTFIGEVNPVTNARKRGDFVNNSICYMEGLDPDGLTMEYVYGKNGDNTISNLISNDKEYNYWLQDCVITGGKFYSFTDNVVTDNDNTELPEGFRFYLVGVDMVSFDVKDGRLDYSTQRNIPTPLFVQGKKNIMFGCGIYPNTSEAVMPNPDGYIYIYGIYEIEPGNRQLVVARTLPENIEEFDTYTYFTGQDWSSDIFDCEPIADDLSPEMSIMPMDFGKYKGKYVYTYSTKGVSDSIMAKIGDTPYGPFETTYPLYCMNFIDDLNKEGLKKVYQYNAKAHYNIACEEEILITYNVNCMDYESHLVNGNVYRPRFLRYKEF